mmetsp:Transcript_39673/g.126789  ORF Transcript_39673/g.126789 Transcript_39673/m.126789 type:complete len:230 (-) Transcript_39673:553-1242(-)
MPTVCHIPPKVPSSQGLGSSSHVNPGPASAKSGKQTQRSHVHLSTPMARVRHMLAAWQLETPSARTSSSPSGHWHVKSFTPVTMHWVFPDTELPAHVCCPIFPSSQMSLVGMSSPWHTEGSVPSLNPAQTARRRLALSMRPRYCTLFTIMVGRMVTSPRPPASLTCASCSPRSTLLSASISVSPMHISRLWNPPSLPSLRESSESNTSLAHAALYRWSAILQRVPKSRT